MPNESVEIYASREISSILSRHKFLFGTLILALLVLGGVLATFYSGILDRSEGFASNPVVVPTDSQSTSAISSRGIFQLKQPILNSSDFQNTEVSVELTMPDGWKYIDKGDATKLHIESTEASLIIYTVPSYAGDLYEEKLTTSLIETEFLGTLHRIDSSARLSTFSAQSQFGVEGSYWYSYSNSYSEQNCGPVFDIETGTRNPAAACGGAMINVHSDEGGLVSVNCILVNADNVGMCDDVVKGMKLSINET